jgi:Flp pilus assembly protein TadD
MLDFERLSQAGRRTEEIIMPGLFREIRRREVFRAVGLYVGVAWIVIEGASILLPAFDAPDWTMRALIIVAIIGLPVTIVLAWIFDITESGIHVQAEATDTVVIPFGGRRTDFVVIGVLAVALVFSVYLLITGNRSAVVEAFEPVSVLIADFDNQTGDALFDTTLEQALQIGIESAPFVAGYHRDTAKRVAATLGRSGDSLDEETARLVAVREGIKLVMAGSIEEDDGEYRLYVRALDPKGGEVIAEADVDASNKLSVLEAVGELSGDLREHLGDKSLDREKLIASETFTAKSLEAAQAYAKAQSLQYNGKYAEAIEFYEQAVANDPNFGRAYSGWALSVQSLGRTDEAKELFDKALANLDTMTERERLRTLGLYYSRVSRNRQKAIESYRELVEKFPADDAARNGLAIQYFYTLDFDKALEQGRKLLEIYPSSVMGRSNYALYAMYASDFKTAVDEAEKVRELDSQYFKAFLPMAMQAAARGDIEGGREAYRDMADIGGQAAMTATLGLADLALFSGEFDEARSLLQQGVQLAREAGSQYYAATMYAALGEAELAMDDERAMRDAIGAALAAGGGLSRDVPAALMYLEAGAQGEAQGIADALRNNLQPQSRAYALLIDGLIALEEERRIDAIDMITAGIELADLWLLRFHRGRAFLEAGYPAEALDEFMACLNRQGEATALFLDDLPTYRYMATIPYWLGRAQESLGMRHAAKQNYTAFAARRPADDPLATDARTRLP